MKKPNPAIVALSLGLALTAIPLAANPDAAELPAQPRLSELARPRSASPAGEPSAPKISVGRQIVRHTNPVALTRTVVSGYSNREFLSTHGTVHPNPGRAMVHSLAPLETGANTRGAVKGSFEKGNLAAALAFPLAQEAVRQLVHDGRIDGSEFRENVRPGALAGGFAGGLAGSVAGAAIQSGLASSLGPFGTVAGFFARPMLTWVGGTLGSRFGENASHGNLSLKDTFKQSLSNIQPGRDIGSVVGGTAGMVIGQALIPIPGVGGFVGSIAGTMVGGWLGSKLMHEKSEKDPTAGLLQKGIGGVLKQTPANRGSFSPIASLAAPGQ